MNGHFCDNCECHLDDSDYTSYGSWSYTCHTCGFTYRHGASTAQEQVDKFNKKGVYTAQQAQQRVVNSEALREHYQILCEYDWPNAQEHIDWVASATESEIIEWALSQEEDDSYGYAEQKNFD